MTRVMEDPGLRRAVRLAIALAMAAGLVVVASPARACSCAMDGVREAIARSDGAFVGRWIDRAEMGDGFAAVTFEVERVVKGSFGPKAIVRTNAQGSACGLEFLDGPRTGLLLDRAADGVWESGLCQQVPPNDLLALAPDAFRPNPAVDPIDPGSAFPWWVLVLGGAFVVGGSLFLATRARRRVAP